MLEGGVTKGLTGLQVNVALQNPKALPEVIARTRVIAPSIFDGVFDF
jgi:hypothetical protein